MWPGKVNVIMRCLLKQQANPEGGEDVGIYTLYKNNEATGALVTRDKHGGGARTRARDWRARDENDAWMAMAVSAAEHRPRIKGTASTTMVFASPPDRR